MKWWDNQVRDENVKCVLQKVYAEVESLSLLVVIGLCMRMRKSHESISNMHQRTGHFELNRTLNFVRKTVSLATENDVRTVANNCKPRQSIDPVPMRWMKRILDI